MTCYKTKLLDMCQWWWKLLLNHPWWKKKLKLTWVFIIQHKFKKRCIVEVTSRSPSIWRKSPNVTKWNCRTCVRNDENHSRVDPCLWVDPQGTPWASLTFEVHPGNGKSSNIIKKSHKSKLLYTVWDQSYWPRADLWSKVTKFSIAWKILDKQPLTWLLPSN